MVFRRSLVVLRALPRNDVLLGRWLRAHLRSFATGATAAFSFCARTQQQQQHPPLTRVTAEDAPPNCKSPPTFGQVTWPTATHYCSGAVHLPDTAFSYLEARTPCRWCADFSRVRSLAARTGLAQTLPTQNPREMRNCRISPGGFLAKSSLEYRVSQTSI